ncbi:MAG: hypothetical protein AVDCRST_MAG08-227, partial [uncultured Acetobacteraceae bacterium]
DPPLAAGPDRLAHSLAPRGPGQRRAHPGHRARADGARGGVRVPPLRHRGLHAGAGSGHVGVLARRLPPRPAATGGAGGDAWRLGAGRLVPRVPCRTRRAPASPRAPRRRAGPLRLDVACPRGRRRRRAARPRHARPLRRPASRRARAGPGPVLVLHHARGGSPRPGPRRPRAGDPGSRGGGPARTERRPCAHPRPYAAAPLPLDRRGRRAAARRVRLSRQRQPLERRVRARAGRGAGGGAGPALAAGRADRAPRPAPPLGPGAARPGARSRGLLPGRGVRPEPDGRRHRPQDQDGGSAGRGAAGARHARRLRRAAGGASRPRGRGRGHGGGADARVPAERNLPRRIAPRVPPARAPLRRGGGAAGRRAGGAAGGGRPL